MKLLVKEVKEIEIKKVEIKLYIPYEELPQDLPFRKDEIWNPVIDVNEGRIVNWPENYPISIFLKVRDSGCYYLIDENENVVSSIEDDYVPNELLPGKYGDYLELNIGPDGKILNWKKDACLGDFQDSSLDDF